MSCHERGFQTSIWDLLFDTIKMKKNFLKGSHYLTFVSMALHVGPTSCLNHLRTVNTTRAQMTAGPVGPSTKPCPETHFLTFLPTHGHSFIPTLQIEKNLYPKIKSKKRSLKKGGKVLWEDTERVRKKVEKSLGQRQTPKADGSLGDRQWGEGVAREFTQE